MYARDYDSNSMAIDAAMNLVYYGNFDSVEIQRIREYPEAPYISAAFNRSYTDWMYDSLADSYTLPIVPGPGKKIWFVPFEPDASPEWVTQAAAYYCECTVAAPGGGTGTGTDKCKSTKHNDGSVSCDAVNCNKCYGMWHPPKAKKVIVGVFVEAEVIYLDGIRYQ